MKKLFTKILVGVDLTRCHPLAAANLGAITRETIDRATALAKANAAQLTFLAALNLSEETLQHLPEDDRTHVEQTVRQGAEDVLDDLVKEARKKRVKAAGKLVAGKGWSEIMREVQRGQHDLVVVGTRNLTGLRRMLFGNTAMKLLRRCPCPVLVTKMSTHARPLNIAVATDLKPAGVEATRLAVGLARQLKARLHILHVVEYPLDRIWSTGLAASRESVYHQRVRADAEQRLNAQLAETEVKALGENVSIHLADGIGIADVAIQHFIQVHHIDLLVMGTIGRTGIPGVMIGNTAERVLPEVHCSVLGVKPPDFQSPVQL